MGVCSYYQRGACKFGGKRPAITMMRQTHMNQIPAKMNTLEVREMQTVEAALAVLTTTALAPSMAIAIVLGRTADPTRSEVCQVPSSPGPAQHMALSETKSFSNHHSPSTGSRDSKPPSFHLDRDDMKNDLTTQRPIYPLSCYGPGREAPRQLIEGPVEISPDELRLRYYTLRAAGNEPQAVSLAPQDCLR